MRLPKISIEVALSMADEKIARQKQADEMADMRQSILTNLLVDVADVFNVPLATVQSGDQQQLTVLVRSIFYYVARQKSEYGLKAFAKTAGRKDHAGCIKHLQKIEAFLKVCDTEFIALWNHYRENSKLFTLKDFPDGQN